MTDGVGADATITIELADWAAVLGGKASWADLVDAGEIMIDGDRSTVATALDCFDLDGLRSGS